MHVISCCRLNQKGMARMPTRQSPPVNRRASLKAPLLRLQMMAEPDAELPTEAARMSQSAF